MATLVRRLMPRQWLKWGLAVLPRPLVPLLALPPLKLPLLKLHLRPLLALLLHITPMFQ
jgi:hypothetical protein